NKSADPANSPTRVRLTLLYVNKFIGAALGHLQADDPQWWCGFSEALCAIDYESPAWTMALVGALAQGKDGKDQHFRGSRDSGRQEPTRRPAIPEAIRRLVPVNRRASELAPVSFLPGRQPAGSKPMAARRPAPTASPRRVVSLSTAAKWHANARERSDLLRHIRRDTLAKAMSMRGIELPTDNYPVSRNGDAGPEFLLNKPLQHALSELARRTGASLPAIVELVRGQTPSDYRPNKNLVPEVLEKLCKDYEHLDALQRIVREGVEVRLKQPPPLQRQRPPNHGSARDRLNVLRKNIRKEQDAGRCLVLDRDLLEQWPEIIISPFGVVDKGHEDAASSGRTIHDLSFPEGASINDCTDQDSITKPDYVHCDAVATEILRLKRAHSASKICVMAGDVASAFRNIGIHSNSVYLFAGHIEEDDVIVIELVAPFGWTGSPGFYEIAGGAIAHVHGAHANDVSP
ncbi:hypothetical protein BBJ28_00027123, partial [Nothophytophthora sp. Chile5]